MYKIVAVLALEISLPADIGAYLVMILKRLLAKTLHNINKYH